MLTEYAPGLYESLSGASVAYLADVYNINCDSTNYWVFSDTGFRCLLKRANWEVCDYLLIGGQSGLAGAIGGQRAFCIAKSMFADDGVRVLLGNGWHAPEDAGWRWTAQHFSIRAETRNAALPHRLEMHLYIPEIAFPASGGLRLDAVLNGKMLAPEHFSRPGEWVYVRTIAAGPPAVGDLRIDFSVNRAILPDASDARERGIIVSTLDIIRVER